MGNRCLAGLRRLQESHPLIGDLRGSFLFLRIELVRDRKTLEPAAAEASYIVNRLKELGILTGTDGPLHNVIKIRPPMVVGAVDVDLFLERLEQVLNEDAVRVGSFA